MLPVISQKAGQPRRALSVLIVDHRDHFALAVERTLAHARFAVRKAKSASSANDELQSFSPDLVVLYCELSDESGWLLASKWALRPNRSRIWLYKALPSANDENWLRYSRVEKVFYHANDTARLTAELRLVAETGFEIPVGQSQVIGCNRSLESRGPNLAELEPTPSIAPSVLSACFAE